MNELLRVEGMSVGFGSAGHKWVPVTDNISFAIGRGEVFALVGESGCGKSVTAMGILGLLPKPSARVLAGHAWLGDVDLLDLPSEPLCAIRGRDISVIFQEPALALNPVCGIQAQLREAVAHLPRLEADVRIASLLRRAGFSDVPRVLSSFPHELSGGMLQRVMIVMALLPGPKLLIADEPTTALDVTVQAQVMMVLKGLCKSEGTGLLLITHNLGLVAQYADRVGVMYAGRMVECAPVRTLLKSPAHPYTQGLIDAVPEGHESVRNLRPIPGVVPYPRDFEAGCRFRSRCSKATADCIAFPPSANLSPLHSVSCFHPSVPLK
jgi:oligopeptide/dipeptide ABC transporter ATP-binding protein